jgi:hypothetical protein
MDTQGRFVAEAVVREDYISLDALAPGMYMVELTGSGRSAYTKLVVE